LSVNDRDKKHVGPLGKELKAMGFRLLATRGTTAALEAAGIEAEAVFKVNEGRPNIVDLVKTGKIDLVIIRRWGGNLSTTRSPSGGRLFAITFHASPL